MQAQLLAGLFFAVVIALFALQNTAPVTVRFLTFALEGVALALIILVTAALAAGATMLLGITRTVRHGAQERELRRALVERDAELARLQGEARSDGTSTEVSHPSA